MNILLAPLLLGASAVGVYYFTRKNRSSFSKKHTSKRSRRSFRRRSSRGGGSTMYSNKSGLIIPRPGSDPSSYKPYPIVHK